MTGYDSSSMTTTTTTTSSSSILGGDDHHGLGAVAMTAQQEAESYNDHGTMTTTATMTAVEVSAVNAETALSGQITAFTANDQSRILMWYGWGSLSAFCFLFVLFVFADVISNLRRQYRPLTPSAAATSSGRRRQRRRKSPFNLYLVFLMVPDLIMSGACACACFLSAMQGSFYSVTMCYFQSWYVIFGFTGSAWMNALIAKEVYNMLHHINASPIRYKPPNLTTIARNSIACLVGAGLVSSWGLWGVSWSPLRTGLNPSGISCFPSAKPNNPWSQLFYYTCYLGIMLGIPLFYVCWLCYKIAKYQLLPADAGRRERVLALFFFRLGAIFLIMWLPALVMVFVAGRFVGPWIEYVGGIWAHMQGFVSASFILTKMDIHKSARRRLTDMLDCCCCCFFCRGFSWFTSGGSQSSGTASGSQGHTRSSNPRSGDNNGPIKVFKRDDGDGSLISGFSPSVAAKIFGEEQVPDGAAAGDVDAESKKRTLRTHISLGELHHDHRGSSSSHSGGMSEILAKAAAGLGFNSWNDRPVSNNSGDQPQPLTIPPFALPASSQDDDGDGDGDDDDDLGDFSDDLGDFSDDDDDEEDCNDLPVFSPRAGESGTIGLASFESASEVSSLSTQKVSGSSNSSSRGGFKFPGFHQTAPSVDTRAPDQHQTFRGESDQINRFPSSANRAQTANLPRRQPLQCHQPDNSDDLPPPPPLRYDRPLSPINDCSHGFKISSISDLPCSQASDDAMCNSMSSRVAPESSAEQYHHDNVELDA